MEVASSHRSIGWRIGLDDRDVEILGMAFKGGVSTSGSSSPWGLTRCSGGLGFLSGGLAFFDLYVLLTGLS